MSEELTKSAIPAGKGRTRKQAAAAGGRYGELGRTGLRQFGGIIHEEFLHELRGVRATRVFKEMAENDPTVGAVLFVIQSTLRNVDWRVAPYSDDPRHFEQAEIVDSLRTDMSHTWADLICEVLSMLVFGYAPLEIVYKRREGPLETNPSRRSLHSDGLIGWRKLAIRAQESVESWVFDDEGGLKGLEQRTDDGHVATIPIEKLLLFRTTSTKNSPEGRSILRNAFIPWYRKRRAEEAESIGLERDLAGMPIFYLPPEIFGDATKLATYTRIADNVKNDEYSSLVLPSVYDENGNQTLRFELAGTGSRRLFDTNAIVGRHDRAIARTVLADFLFLGADKVGSFALSSDRTDLFAVALGGWLGEIASVLNRHGLTRLYKLNGWDPSETAEFVPGDLEEDDLQRFAEAVEKLVGVGFLTPGGDEDEAHVRQLLGLPEKEEEEEPPPDEVPTAPGFPPESEPPPPDDDDAGLEP